MVRAKITALRLDQSPEDATAWKKLERHIKWAEPHDIRPPGKLLLTCGLSGTGKSYWATRLAPDVNAVRLRFDVLRKRQHGLSPDADTGSGVGKGLYTPAQSERVYQELAKLATTLLTAGENVIVDAANLRLSQRQTLYCAAKTAGSNSTLLYLTAPEAVLRQRLETRRRASNDPSEADVAVLEWQQANADLPTENEPLLTVDTRASKQMTWSL
jgi:predicted kinase